MSLYSFLNHLYLIVLISSLLVGIILFRTQNIITKAIFGLIVCSVIAETIGYYTLHITSNKLINSFNYNIYTFFEIICIGYFFYLVLEGRFIKHLVAFFSLILIILNLYYTFENFWLSACNVFVYLLIGIYHIVLAMVFFTQILMSNKAFFNEPAFYIVTGLLFYYAGGFMLSGLIDILVEKNIYIARKVFTLKHLLNIIQYSLFAIAFYIQWKNKKSYRSL